MNEDIHGFSTFWLCVGRSRLRQLPPERLIHISVLAFFSALPSVPQFPRAYATLSTLLIRCNICFKSRMISVAPGRISVVGPVSDHAYARLICIPMAIRVGSHCMNEPAPVHWIQESPPLDYVTKGNMAADVRWGWFGECVAPSTSWRGYITLRAFDHTTFDLLRLLLSSARHHSHLRALSDPV
jgi:hypothetical protein